MLTKGKGISIWVPGFIWPASITDWPMISHSLWLRGTPLACASVPEVQQMVSTSWAVRPMCCMCARSAAASHTGAAARAARRSWQPGGKSSPYDQMACTLLNCAACCAHCSADL